MSVISYLDPSVPLKGEYLDEFLLVLRERQASILPPPKPTGDTKTAPTDEARTAGAKYYFKTGLYRHLVDGVERVIAEDRNYGLDPSTLQHILEDYDRKGLLERFVQRDTSSDARRDMQSLGRRGDSVFTLNPDGMSEMELVETFSLISWRAFAITQFSRCRAVQFGDEAAYIRENMDQTYEPRGGPGDMEFRAEQYLLRQQAFDRRARPSLLDVFEEAALAHDRSAFEAELAARRPELGSGRQFELESERVLDDIANQKNIRRGPGRS
jgi:hypothetical protein